MLEAFINENGIHIGNISISDDLSHVSCGTAHFINFDKIGVAKDCENKTYTAMMFINNYGTPLGSARAKFRDEKSNQLFEKWLKEHNVPIFEN